MLPVIPSDVLLKAQTLWNESIDHYGRLVEISDSDGAVLVSCKAFCKRPKIMGLFDRTEQSFDQERYMVILKAADITVEPAKFYSIRWDEEDHAVISTTQVDLMGVVFGYRTLAKG